MSKAVTIGALAVGGVGVAAGLVAIGLMAGGSDLAPEETPPQLEGLSLLPEDYIGTKFTRYADSFKLTEPVYRFVTVGGRLMLRVVVDFEDEPPMDNLACPYAANYEVICDGVVTYDNLESAPGNVVVLSRFARNLPKVCNAFSVRVTSRFYNVPNKDACALGHGGSAWGEPYSGASNESDAVRLEFDHNDMPVVDGEAVDVKSLYEE